MRHLVWVSKIDEYGLVIVSNPPVNALNPEIVEAIRNSLKSAEQDHSIKAIILTAMGPTFIAGSDINEFRNLGSSRKRHESLLHPLLPSLEDCRKPIICAIHGMALGGGLEIALACHYRVAAASAQVGFPEVNLGLIPGGGGTPQANVDRWIGQFTGSGGKPSADTAKIYHKTVHSIPLTIVDVSGTYSSSMGSMQTGEQSKPGFRMLGAIAESREGPWFFKLTGPERTVAKWQSSFESFLDSINQGQ